MIAPFSKLSPGYSKRNQNVPTIIGTYKTENEPFELDKKGPRVSVDWSGRVIVIVMPLKRSVDDGGGGIINAFICTI